jgi:hypothetical protein
MILAKTKTDHSCKAANSVFQNNFNTIFYLLDVSYRSAFALAFSQLSVVLQIKCSAVEYHENSLSEFHEVWYGSYAIMS